MEGALEKRLIEEVVETGDEGASGDVELTLAFLEDGGLRGREGDYQKRKSRTWNRQKRRRRKTEKGETEEAEEETEEAEKEKTEEAEK